MLEYSFQKENKFLKWTIVLLNPKSPNISLWIIFQIISSIRWFVDRKVLYHCKKLIYKIDISESQEECTSKLWEKSEFFKVLLKLILFKCLQKVLT